MLQSGVAHFCRADEKILELWKFADGLQRVIGNLRPADGQVPQVFQTSQMSNAGVGDLRILQVELFQGVELADVAQVLVVDFSAFQRKHDDVAPTGYCSRSKPFKRPENPPLFFQRSPARADPTQQ